jgi:outer membrane protein OmpA-like peptidoglycan-associated protein
MKREGRAPRRRSAGALWALLVSGLLSGCAGQPGVSELERARASVERARRSPTAERARLELYEAEVALAQAEREAARGGRRAHVYAYVARRRADQARLEGLNAAEKEATALARTAAARLQLNLERRAAAAADQAVRLEEEARRREAARPALISALDRVRGGRGELFWDEETIRLRLPTETLFETYRPVLLRSGAERLAAVAEAIRAGPPCAVWIRVLDDIDGLTMDRHLLSRRRAARIREALMDHNVPAEYFFAHPEPPGPIPLGTQVDLYLVAEPVRVPPVRSLP